MTSEASPEKYELLWVHPAAGAAHVPSVNELEEALGGLYAHVMFGTSLERQRQGQTAVHLFGFADKATVTAKLKELRYNVVDEEIRPLPTDSFPFTDW